MMLARVLRAGVFAAGCSLLPAVSAAQEEPHWTYSGHGGPSEWGSLSPAYAACSRGARQSPIDIPVGNTWSTASVGFSYRPSGLSIVNNGHTVQVNYDAGSFIELGAARYDLVQFHFHGPSEHAVAGKHEPMELHLVHRNADGALAVVGVLLSEGAANPAFDPVMQNLPASKGMPSTVAGASVDVERLLPTARAFWSYPGSLTTPPCSEGVTWIVMKAPVELSRGQIEAFRGVIHSNARPVQPLAGRTVTEARP